MPSFSSCLRSSTSIFRPYCLGQLAGLGGQMRGRAVVARAVGHSRARVTPSAMAAPRARPAAACGGIGLATSRSPLGQLRRFAGRWAWWCGTRTPHRPTVTRASACRRRSVPHQHGQVLGHARPLTRPDAGGHRLAPGWRGRCRPWTATPRAAPSRPAPDAGTAVLPGLKRQVALSFTASASAVGQRGLSSRPAPVALPVITSSSASADSLAEDSPRGRVTWVWKSIIENQFHKRRMLFDSTCAESWRAASAPPWW
jgi:hypothetical protein